MLPSFSQVAHRRQTSPTCPCQTWTVALPPRVVDPAPAEVPIDLGTTVVLAPSVTMLAGGVLFGGAPARLLRPSDAATAVLEAWRAPSTITTHAEGALARKLERSGLVNVVAPAPHHGNPPSVTVVIPTRGRAAGVAKVLAQTATFGVTQLVVDDGSSDAEASALAELCATTGATLVRLEQNGGPSIARNAGAEAAQTELVCFCDSDLDVVPSNLLDLTAHFADPLVAAVAPRIGVTQASGPLAAYESCSSPLDLGPNPSDVMVRGTVSFVPTACILARRSLAATFDPTLGVAEDVDWEWTLLKAGWIIRYDPSIVVSHPMRSSVRAFLNQRRFYGSGAGPLALRHGDAVAPIATSGFTALAALGLVSGQLLVTRTAMAVATTLLRRRIAPLTEHPTRTAARIVVVGSARAMPSLLRQTIRTYGPLLVLAGAKSATARRVLVLGTLATALPRWRRSARGLISPVHFAALQALDDLAYATGVLSSATRRETRGAVRPSLTWFRSSLSEESLSRSGRRLGR